MKPLSLDDNPSVQLGGHIYEVVPQPLPYLKRHLGRTFSELVEGAEGLSGSNVMAWITGRAWDVLKVFIPDLMPLYEWEGYGSQAQMEADDYDEALMRTLAPTGPQTKTALELCMRANGLDVYKTLGRLVDPTLLQGIVTKLLAESLTKTSANDSSPPARTPSMTSSSPASPTEASTGPSEPMVVGSPSTPLQAAAQAADRDQQASVV